MIVLIIFLHLIIFYSKFYFIIHSLKSYLSMFHYLLMLLEKRRERNQLYLHLAELTLLVCGETLNTLRKSENRLAIKILRYSKTLVIKVLCGNKVFFTSLPYAAIKTATCLYVMTNIEIFLIN